MSDEVVHQRLNLPLTITPEKCSGGTYIVTGANTGLGLEAAKHLVAVGAAKVILAVRNIAAGEAAKDRIIKETGKLGTAEVWALDLTSYESVKTFASKAIEELDRIDAVIENAAVASAHGRAEGHLLSMTVNVYSTLLLGVLLLPKLEENAQRYGITPHLTIVTSGASFDTHSKWNEIKDDPLAKMDNESIGLLLWVSAIPLRLHVVFCRSEFADSILYRYPISKLIGIFAIRKLASLLPVSKTGVVLNLVNPGLCKTELSRNAPPAFQQQLSEMHARFGRTAEDGSRTLLHGAVAGKESHGVYLNDCEPADHKLPSWITDEEGNRTQDLLWGALARELEVISPGCIHSII
ncbi:short-chain dehydrogenase/reductase family protein, putative [Talaromyces stipitatus ATCC 10500]|uniref:Short-chain dehydrogenase/reductase family protein, putative n=1 Tax=Talaromyces stipitatus (strain ATCC 10500 / CBS 375.48 / QM 6759 / NRRL 1006) TaxID=441959 RepID=B8M947_TALSN|nr:short-chain dehydrogenase/reductase family protein, putative [Talaromyces stipitatus ATCC 10500]EED17342.1 short-chain dehydrogenase/reductase family protein, putative [Talaromyces stipitatus ATCC 10500]